MAELTAEEQKQFEALQAKSGQVVGGMQKKDIAPLFFTMAETIKGMQTQLDGLQGQRQQQQQQQQQQEEQRQEEAVNLNELSNEDLVLYVTEKVKKEQAQPLAQEMMRNQQAQKTAELTKQAEAANKAHDDFQHYMPEMKEVLKANPSLNIEQAYQLAKLEDGEKVAKVDELMKEQREKAAEEQTKEKEGKGADVIHGQFGGLTPTSSITTENDAGDMTQKEAASAAWEASEMDDALNAFANS